MEDTTTETYKKVLKLTPETYSTWFKNLEQWLLTKDLEWVVHTSKEFFIGLPVTEPAVITCNTDRSDGGSTGIDTPASGSSSRPGNGPDRLIRAGGGSIEHFPDPNAISTVSNPLTAAMIEALIGIEKSWKKESDSLDELGIPKERKTNHIRTLRVRKWEKDNAMVCLRIIAGLNEFDTERVEHLRAAQEKLKALRDRYFDTRPIIAKKATTDLLGYKKDPDTSIDEAWVDIRKLRLEIVRINPSQAALFSEDYLMNILLDGLSDEYSTIRDSLRAQLGLTVNYQLSVLKDKETELDKDSALVAAQRWRNKDRSREKSSSRERTHRTDRKKPYQPSRLRPDELTCHICKTSGHVAKDCPLAEKFRKFLKKSGSKSDHKRPDKPRHKPKGKGKGPLKRKQKGYTADDGEDSSDPSDETDDSEDSSTDPSESNDEAEEAMISRDLSKRKSTLKRRQPIRHNRWCADSGASSNMTDDLNLFISGSLRRIKKRLIKVGGGFLYSRMKGIARVQDREGRMILLKDTLYVPKLGVSLLSCRRMCEQGLKGSFDDKALYLHQGTQLVMRAKIKKGLYIIDKVHDTFPETAFAGKLKDPETLPDAPATAMPDDDSLEDDTDTEAEEETGPIDQAQKDRYDLWHRRFAHLGVYKIRHLHDVTTLKKKIRIPSKLAICKPCKVAKMRNRIDRKVRRRKDKPLDLVSIDICGPLPVSLKGNRYFLQIVDNYSRMVWIYPVKDRKEAMEALRKWKKSVELQTEYKLIGIIHEGPALTLKAVRSDNAPEIKEVLDEWAREEGIQPEYTVVHSSHQNGVAERSIQSSENSIRAMIEDADLPIEFWDEAALTDAYIRCRTATGPIIDGKVQTPYQAFYGEVPSIDHMRVWGCICYSYVDPKSLPASGRTDKFMPRARQGIFMGYTLTASQYRVYAPDLGYVISASRVDFDEDGKGGTIKLNLKRKDNPDLPSQGTPNVLPARRPVGRPKKAKPAEKAPQNIGPPEAPLKPVGKENTPNATVNDQPPTTPAPVHIPVEDPKPDEPPKGSRFMSHVAIPTLKRTAEAAELEPDNRLNKIIRALIAHCTTDDLDSDHSDNDYSDLDGYETDETDIEEYESAMMAGEKGGISIPKTYNEAIDDKVYGKQWKKAIQDELDQLTANGTFEATVPPKGSNIVTCKWVFNVKLHENGSISKFKARLVARGFSQLYGIDYTQTFAPTVRMDTLRVFFAIIALLNLETGQVDVNNAFTESTLREKIFMDVPQGMTVLKGKKLRIKRSLYGLKQSARDWHSKCADALKTLGFKRSLADPCLFTLPERGIILLVYVDDFGIAAPKKADVDWFKAEFGKIFKLKDLGEINEILGVRITRNRRERTLVMSQGHYIKATLDLHGITKEKSKPQSIPMNGLNACRPANDEDERICQSTYQQQVGGLMWGMVVSRPDYALALGKLSQYMSDPAVHHVKALKTLMRYVKGTEDLSIRYGPKYADDDDDRTNLIGYTDADWASDKTDRKSVTGHVFMLANGPVSWASKKQRSVSTSTTESEYIAQSAAAKQAVWLSQILTDMGYAQLIGPRHSPVQMKGDNQGAIALVENPHLHERSKHIDICYHHVRDLAEKRRIEITYIPTDEMVADGLTKPLAKAKFEEFIYMLGMVRNRKEK